MLRVRTLLSCALLLLATAMQVAPAATFAQTPAVATPEHDAFYAVPSPLPPAEPGSLIRSEQLPAPDGVRAWRILYHSTTLDGEDVAVSGTVFAPDREAPEGGFPLLAVGHNTTGIAPQCAPSLDPFQPLAGTPEAFYQQQVAGFVDGGFAAVAPDYQGLGVPADVHPFLVGETAAYNMLDAIRAARALPGLALAPGTMLWGHSQGGHAAAWAGQLASAYAPDVPIDGLILGAPAAEPGLVLAAARELQQPSPLTGYIVTLVHAWEHVYPELASSPGLTPDGQARADRVLDACIPFVAAAFADQLLSAYVETDTLMAPPWATYIEHNAAGRLPVDVPVLVVQGTSDALVPAAVTEAFVRRWCELGTDVQLQLYPDVGHGEVIQAAMPEILTWAADRLAGKPSSPTC